MLATYRVDDELAPAVRRLATELSRRPLVRRVELGPLGPEDVARQLAVLRGEHVPATLARELHARAGGNPFFVEELFAARTDTVTEAVLARVARLDGDMLAVRPPSADRAATRCWSGSTVAPDALRAALDAGRARARARRPRVPARADRRGRLRAAVPRRARGAAPLARRRAPGPGPARAPVPPRRAARRGARGLDGGGNGGRARPRARRGARALRAGARALGRVRGPRRAALPRRPGRALQRRSRARRGALPRGARARAGAGPARGPLRAPRRVPLLGRRDGPGLLRARARAAPGEPRLLRPRATR